MTHRSNRETKTAIKPYSLNLSQITGMTNVNFDNFSKPLDDETASLQ